MKITLPLTFDIDPGAWAEDYGLDPTEAIADITAVLTRAAIGDDLVALIRAAWPMMREHTIVVGQPGTVLAAIDWTHDVATTEARNLTAHGHGADALAFALNDALREDSVANIVTLVRAYIADNYGPDAVDYDPDAPSPIAVVFEADEWDNGWFLSGTGAVYFADGITESNVDFGVDTELTDAYGTVGPQSGLVVDLRTGDTAFDDNVGGSFLSVKFGLPVVGEVAA